MPNVKYLFPKSEVTSQVTDKLVDVNLAMVKPGGTRMVELRDDERIDLTKNIPAFCDGARLYLLIHEYSKYITYSLAFVLTIVLYIIFQKYELGLLSQILVYVGIGSVIIMSSLFTTMKKIVVLCPSTQLVYFPKTFTQPEVTVSYGDVFFRAGNRSAYIVSKKSATKTGKWARLPMFINGNDKSELFSLIKTIDKFMSSPTITQKLNNNLAEQVNWFSLRKTSISELTDIYGSLTINNDNGFSIIEAR